LVNFFVGVVVSEFRVKELVLTASLLSGIYGSMLVGIGRGGVVVNSGF